MPQQRLPFVQTSPRRDSGPEKKNGAANTVTKRIAVPVELRPQPSTLRILLLTVTASQKARHELPKSRIYELFSR
ncbi:hypothetical protein HRG_012586 [Hirsutella rhossiliensis]